MASKSRHVAVWCDIMNKKFSNLNIFEERDPVPLETRSTNSSANLANNKGSTS